MFIFFFKDEKLTKKEKYPLKDKKGKLTAKEKYPLQEKKVWKIVLKVEKAVKKVVKNGQTVLLRWKSHKHN